MRSIRPLPIIVFSLFTLSLLSAVILDSHFLAKVNRTSAGKQALEVENVAAKRYWEYLRLRDPATGEIPRGIHARELAFARTIGMSATAMKAAPTIQSTGWASAGPNNTGGRTQAIGIDIVNEANVMIATAQGGIFRSTDSGQTWNRTSSPDGLKDLMCLTQDHRAGKTGTWYCGSGELLSTTDRKTTIVGAPRWRTTDIGDGIYKSQDNGKSWFLLPSTHDATETTLDSAFDGVWNMVVDNSKATQDVVYAAGFGAIMRSSDGGSSWAKVLGDPSHKSFCTDVQITSKGIVYAYLSQFVQNGSSSPIAGVWRSIDGINWTNITPASWPKKTQRLKIAIAPSDENTLYVGGSDDGAGQFPILFKYTYVSGDGSGSGGTWENRSSNLPTVTDAQVSGASTLGGYAVVLRVFPTDPNTVFFGGTNLFRSSDGFASKGSEDWISGYDPDPSGPQSYPHQHPDNHDLVFSPSSPNRTYSADDGGMYETYDILGNDFSSSNYTPVTWQTMNTNDVASIIYVVGIDHATPGDSTIVGGFQDQGSWITSGSRDWNQYDGGDGGFCAIADKQTAFYMCSQYASLRRWVYDSIKGWDVTGIRPSGISDPQFVSPWMLDPSNTNRMFLAANDSLWRNDDLNGIPSGPVYGETMINWTRMDNCALHNGAYITALGVSVQPLHRLYYGTSDGHLYRVNNCTAVAPSPTEITSASFPKNSFISCVAVDPNNADSIVVCFSNYHIISVFASNDGGVTWRNASGNLEQNPDGSGDGPSTRWVSIIHKNGQTLYLIGTSVGLFSTTDISGPNVTWMPEGLQTIGRTIVENIDVRQSDGFIAIATQGSGVYTATVIAPQQQQGVQSAVGGQDAVTLSPNPASDRSIVSVQSQSTGHLQISVSDLTGRQLTRIYDGASTRGLSNYSFDCSRLPSGTYFVQVRTDEAVESKRLVIKR